MSEELVPTVACHATSQEVYAALRGAWAEVVGEAPDGHRPSILLLLAQWSVETGNGAACNNWNLAGIKHVPGDGHSYATYNTVEYRGPNRTKWVGPQNFRAYATLEEGALDFLRVLRGDFGFAWPAVEAGEIDNFAHRLKQRGYFTATEESYDSLLKVRFAELDREIPPDPPPTLPDASDPVSDELVSEIEAGTLTKDRADEKPMAVKPDDPVS